MADAARQDPVFCRFCGVQVRLNGDCVSRKHAVGKATIGANEAACEGSGQLPVASKAQAHAPAGLSDSKTTLSRKIQDAGQSHEQKKQRLEERGEERNDVSWHCEEDEYSDEDEDEGEGEGEGEVEAWRARWTTVYS